MSFNGKVVIITGAASGIGAATAHRLAKLGAKLAIVDRNQAKLHEMADELVVGGSLKPFLIVADLTKDGERIVNETVKHFGQLDILVNNAGILDANTLIDFDVNAYDRVMDTNLRSMIVLTHHAIPHLEQTKGNIVNVSSVAGINANEKFIAYSISKAGVNQFTKCAALTLAPKGIRVNAVAPGLIRTPIYAQLGITNEMEQQFYEQHKCKYSMERVGEGEDVAAGIAYLATETFVNGIVLTIDDGYLLKH